MSMTMTLTTMISGIDLESYSEVYLQLATELK